MRTFAKITAIILALILAFSAVGVTAFAAEDSSVSVSASSGTTGDCTWSVEDKVLTISGSGSTGDLSSILTQPPWDNSVTTAIVEEGVTRIGNYFFRNSYSLSSITLPESVTEFGTSALNKSALGVSRTIYAPSGSYTETYCNENTLTFQASSGTTGDCTWRLEGTVLIISGNGAMADCVYDGDKEKFILPWGDKITKVIIEEGVTEVGKAAFYKCGSLKEVVLPEGLTTIKPGAFYECKKLETVVFPEGLTTIGEHAFERCTGLKEIDLPEGLTLIDSSAFCNCTNLSSVKFPESLNKIGGYAFENCKALTSLTIPENTATINSCAFRGCSNIKELYVYNKTCKLGWAFMYTSLNGMTVYGYLNSTAQSFVNDNKDTYSITFVQLKEYSKTGECFYELDGTKLRIFGSGKMGDYTYSSPAPWGTAITSVTIEDGVQNVGSYAFRSSKGIMEVTLPDSVTELGNYAFMYCDHLESVNIPAGVTVISEGFLEGCSALGSVELHEGITEIGNFAFSQCKSLTSVTLPESLETLGNQAFYGCGSLTSFNLTKNVTQIGYNILGGGNNISTLTVDPENTVYDSRESCNAIIETATNTLLMGCKNTTIPASVTTIGNSAFDWCTGLKSIEIPGTVKTVGFNAFNYSGVTEVMIDEGVEKLDTQAFGLCLYLKKITIPESVTDISSTAFNGTKNFTIYGYEGSYAQQYAEMKSFPFVALPKPVHTLSIGDVNGDKNIDVLDAIAVQKFAAEKSELSAEQLYAADVNNDNNVDVLDAIDIQKYSAEIIDHFKKS